MLKKLMMAILMLSSTLAYSEEHRPVRYKVVKRPQHVCWNEAVQSKRQNYTGAIIGGVAGGLLGSQLGGGNGRIATTAVGAGTGAIVGDSIARNRHQHTVRHCRTVMKRVRVPVYTKTIHD